MGKGFERDRPSGRTRRTASGQRSKLTDERGERILELLRKGAYITTAAHAVGIHPQTIHTWMSAGARLEDQERDDYTDDEEMLIWFTWEARKAMAEAQLADWDFLKSLAKPGCPGAVTAITWRLERRYPEQFGRRQMLVTGSPDAIKNDFNLGRLSDDQLAQLEQILEAANEESETGE